MVVVSSCAIGIACGLDVVGSFPEPDAAADLPDALEASLPANDVITTEVDAGPCTAKPCVVAVAAEHLHTCVALFGEPPRCWGANERGELGVVDAGPDGDGVPRIVDNIAGPVDLIATGGFVTIAYRPLTCAAPRGGSPLCWGDDSLGQRGRDGGGSNDASSPEDLAPATTVPNVVATESLSVGGGHVCVRHDDGGVTCWGLGGFAQLGHVIPDATAPSSDPIPTHVPLPRAALSVSAGGFHTCALLDDGTLDCFGLNNVNQLNRADASSREPAILAGLSQVTMLIAGYGHSCAVLASGELQCWGYNTTGQLGHGITSNSDTAKPVVLPGARTAKSACAGFGHSCAILNDDTVACWGANTKGQVGTGTPLTDGGGVDPNTVLVPTLVPNVANVRALSCAGLHTCALRADGSVTCWGANEHGQLGRGMADIAPHPEPAVVVF